jgi:three-Cys-motif partner protein
MDAAGYIRPRVGALLDHSEEIYSEAPGPTNEFDTWSALKLILHSASVRTYTTVHANQGTEDLFYIDALAGTGLSEYDGGYFLGSALLALREVNTPFKKMYFIENKPEYAEILEERLKVAFELPGFSEPEDWEVYQEDANDQIPRVVDEIWSTGDFDNGVNYYCFIDNKAADVKWDAIEELTPKPYGDLLINIPLRQTIGRNINKETTTELDEFYGMDLSNVTFHRNIREQCLQLYLENLANRDRPKQVVTGVDAGTGSYGYELAYVARKTRNGNPWLDAIRYVRDFVEQFHGGDIHRMLEVIQGNQGELQKYLPDNSIDDKVLKDLEQDDESLNGEQAGLSDYF